jgi:predicted acetylornithine/succinylornithine family transaminase
MASTFEEIQKKEDCFQLNTYKKLPLAIESGEGVYVFDSNGKKYLDLYGGHAVALTGHCHPSIVRALQEQGQKLIFYSNVVYSSVRAEASEAVIEVAPEGMNKVFFCNSGAEANETAMKIGRRFSGKTKIVAMKEGFHGRTAGALSATGLGNYRKQFKPLLEDYVFVEFGNIGGLKEALTDDVGSVILEPIQSMAGVEMAEDEYYRNLRTICSERDVVLIFDEVQTGFGRTGSWFFGDGVGIVPDIITLAKGIGGGVPVGGVIIGERISDTIGPGEHGSTFGGGPLASAAVLANIRVIQEENLVQNARDMGDYFYQELTAIDFVRRVKGRGLLLGVEVEADASRLRDYLLASGVITGTSSKKEVLRLLPPLTLKRENAEKFIDVLRGFPG